ncbi:MAG: hypothetical protein ACK4MV_02025 [Beijerinckiaceae bacterium]
MRQGMSRLAPASRGGAAVALLLALSGCGGGSYVGSLFGSSSSSSSAASSQTASAAQQDDAASGPPKSAVLPLFGTGPTELACPYVDVRDGAAAHRVYAGQPSNATVRYQFSMGDIARECRVAGDQLILKVGVEGRVLLGPAGSPGSFTVPVSIAVRDEATEKFILNRNYRVAANIPAGSSGTAFAVVSEEISVPYKGLEANEHYQVFVGFEGASAANAPQAARRRR